MKGVLEMAEDYMYVYENYYRRKEYIMNGYGLYC